MTTHLIDSTFEFDTDKSPDVATLGLITIPTTTFGSGFTTATAIGAVPSSGTFDANLTTGNLLDGQPGISSSPGDAIELGEGNSDTAKDFIDLTWSGSTATGIVNAPGNDLIVFENGSADKPEPFAIAVSTDGGSTFSDFRYEFRDGHGVGDTGLQFYTLFDFSDFGIADGTEVNAIRIENVIATDDVDGADGQGNLVPDTTGFDPVDPVTGDPVPTGNSQFDPDITYVGAVSDVDEQPVKLFDDNGNFIEGYQTLEAAVDAAGADYSIEIAAGSFEVGEQIIIDENLTITGAGMDTTMLTSDFNTGNDSSGDGKGWFLVESGVNFDLSDLTLDGDGQDTWQAIRHKGSGTIDSVKFTDIQFDAIGPSAAYQGTAVVAFGATSDVDITNSVFEEIGRIGVLYFGSGVTGTFEGNTYTGKGDGDFIDYALDISSGAQIEVIDNVVSDNRGVASTDNSVSAAFLITTFFGSNTAATFEGNQIISSSNGIFAGFDTDDSSTVTINAGNGMYDTGTGLVVVGDGDVMGADLLIGDSNNIRFFGGDAGNDFEAGPSDDLLRGNIGDDTLEGLDGDDTIRGGDGTDSLDGGDGNDTLDLSDAPGVVNVDLATDTIIEDGYGNGPETATDFENVIGSEANLSGDTLSGNGDDNIFIGLGGDDELSGLDGDDTLLGGDDDDTLDGGADDDLIAAGPGIDSLTGGSGADIFRLAPGDGDTSLADTNEIDDFEDGIDLIGLAGGLDFSDLTIGSIGGSATIAFGSEFLAVLSGVPSGDITVADFITAPAEGEVLVLDGTDVLSTHADISSAVTAASSGNTVLVGAGTYVENVAIDKSLNLISYEGRETTIIDGLSDNTAAGAIQINSGIDDVTIGGVGQGFTILGIDDGNPAVEDAAIYLLGAHDNIDILDNDVVARGDSGLTSNFGADITNITIDGNTFSGQTFIGPEPAGSGFGGGQQFSLDNVPRQLVVMGSGSSPDPGAFNVVFANNQITGTAGGINSDGEEQGNTLVTIDVADSTISDNTFTGFTNRFASALRSRQPNTDIENNTIDHTVNDSDTFGFAITFDNASYVGNVIIGSDDVDENIANVTSSVAGGGTPGDDDIVLGDGDDVVWAVGGDDVIVGGGGDDDMFGGDGDDFFTGNGGEDDFDGGDDIDTVSYTYSSSDRLRVDLSLETAWFVNDPDNPPTPGVPPANTPTTTETLVSIENIIGSSGDNFIAGDDKDNILDGDGGDDTLIGGGGDDTLIGGTGEDEFDGGDGDGDTVDFTYSSSDRLRVDLSNNIAVFVDDPSSPPGPGNSPSTAESVVNVENVIGTTGDNVLIGDGNNNVLDGDAGNDDLFGGGGDDTLIGGTGSDDFNGGSGSDTVDYSYSSSDRLRVDLSDDLAVFVDDPSSPPGPGNAPSTSEDLISIENVIGTTGDNVIIGDSGDNVLDGNDGDDILSGGTGEDTFIGGDGTDTVDYTYSSSDRLRVDLSEGFAWFVDDPTSEPDEDDNPASTTEGLSSIENVVGTNGDNVIIGDANDNVLNGDDGDDILIGGGGNDILIGGDDDDVFVYATGDDEDTIVDFDDGPGSDIIDATGAGFDTVIEYNALAFSGGNPTVVDDGDDQGGITVTETGGDLVLDFGGGDVLTVLNETFLFENEFVLA